MQAPSRTDYIHSYFTLFDRFQQQHPSAAERGRPVTYTHRLLIIFFTWMLVRRITDFKTQRRWLETHPSEAAELGFPSLPHRTTLMRRYKRIAPIIDAFIAFIGQWAETLDAPCRSAVMVVDGSLFKARGPVWHQRDRACGHIPDKLRNLDQEASWSKSGYHGWVYGYRLHFRCTLAGFPISAQVTTGSTSESTVLDAQERTLLARRPQAVVGDNGFCDALRIRRWATAGVLLVTPASTWRQGSDAQGYHRFLKQKDVLRWLKQRRSAIEPVFALLRHVLGTKGKQKQLPVAGLACVRTFLSLGVLAVQVGMLLNSSWGAPFREVSTIISTFT
ncbi:MAG TPA: transposase [Herpetosiphonaceae bacterium]|nr:transposase [Herpetosiphonaceae bacterium]